MRPKHIRSQPNNYEPRSYGAFPLLNITLNQVDRNSTAVNVLFNQMTATKGLKMFGERAVAAMFKEYKQLDDMQVFGRARKIDLRTNNKRRDFKPSI